MSPQPFDCDDWLCRGSTMGYRVHAVIGFKPSAPTERGLYIEEPLMPPAQRDLEWHEDLHANRTAIIDHPLAQVA